MSNPTPLQALSFPLWGSRLIEASAGTGKTWTIAALYVRLVLGHGAGNAFARPLLPSEILVMTFTRAATRELSDRIRARLLEAARCFRGEQQPAAHDDFLREVLADYVDDTARSRAALRLATAAEMMDEAAVHTIDAWCQRMLREHAFDSGNLFNEELVQNEDELRLEATRDYWREHVYQLGQAGVEAVLSVAASPQGLADKLRSVLALESRPTPPTDFFAQLETAAHALQQLENAARESWRNHLTNLEQSWLGAFEAGWLNKARYNHANTPFTQRLQVIRDWASNGKQTHKDLRKWLRLFTPDGWVFTKAGEIDGPRRLTHPVANHILDWLDAADKFAATRADLILHATQWVELRLAHLKQQAGVFGFADMLQRLDHALSGPNGAALRERIVTQYPVAMVDEFQDTSPIQYRIFDQLYHTAANDPASGLFLIGDPKQSIYGFRGADIYSYLAARTATAGRHYVLTTNYRSTKALVRAANRLFLHAEQNPQLAGAFRYRQNGVNPVPFEAVGAQGRSDQFVTGAGAASALTLWHGQQLLNGTAYQRHFAELTAEHIVGLLNDPQAGFASANGLQRLQPADIAILVRTGKEAAVVRRALQVRGVPSVYLSDKDSVFESGEAADLLRWLAAVANPLDGRSARAAYATPTAGLSLAELSQLAVDDIAWETRVEELKALKLTWQRQGVLAMLRQTLHQLDLPARLLGEIGGERRLTNLLHLAELLQTASQLVEGEQALIRWLAEQIAGLGEGGDERIVRLESDAELVKVVTVHKSKGLEYPLVFLPFACTFRQVDKRNRTLVEYVDDLGQRQVDFSLGDEAMQRAEEARLQEDLRLFYVAVTRARHALWLGTSALVVGNGKKSQLDKSALGYLIAGGQMLAETDLAAKLAELKAECADLALQTVPDTDTALPRTILQQRAEITELPQAPHYHGQFDTSWNIASFSSLIRDLQSWQHVAIPAAETAQAETLSEAPDEAPATQVDDAPWHRFPRGALPGTLLHDQLEWLASEGFDLVLSDNFAQRLGRRCERLGWANRKEDVIAWLKETTLTPLLPINVPLLELDQIMPEMEFWFPSEQLASSTVDALCREHLLDHAPRPKLAERELHGMVKGYADLVFEQDGRYWVLDYKSNALGAGDADYHATALQQAMATHRYDVQAAIYMLALHRLLRQRLGVNYNPAQHLGGAIYLFLRGIKGPERGCYVVPPNIALLDALDAALGEVHA
ncbi:exodeoxyribonuclease V subunit beta [Silvimonas soli]|uniref:exodeoxyribonuclease V subunit beta n=1 Tax=Silvimonas soli TaxID=2980100 RepID=UPI0024B33643|nr:exodeoxyribonuclease V subunit beta [Silvimonas soli]